MRHVPTPKTANTPFVAYYRVSTQQQGRSGLGLDAQQAAVRSYVQAHAGRLIAEFTEIESGRKTARRRPELAAALARATTDNAVLVIAKLDRLARNVAFLATLLEEGREFVALDVPGANRLTLHVLAAVAEDEARRTRERTVAALAAAKARGQRLGHVATLTPRDAGRVNGQQRRAQVRAYYAGALIADLVTAWRAAGWSYGRIATELTARRAKTSTGGTAWTATMARRVFLAASEAAA